MTSKTTPKDNDPIVDVAQGYIVSQTHQMPTYHARMDDDTRPNDDDRPGVNLTSSEEPKGEGGYLQPPSRGTDMIESPHYPTDPPPVPPKPRNRFEDVVDLAPGSTPVKIRQRRKSDTSQYKPDSRVSSPVKNNVEQLEARISSILTEIPAHIRLTSGPEIDAPEVKPIPSDPRTPLPRSKTAPRLSRAQTTTPLPSMILAPAQPKSARSRHSASEPEIKLYHLHQSGKEAPIKLFVRLVGEAGERVMVRIGGGWADLGEYLKEYASHHGKRSASDSRFAIQELPSSPVTSSPATGSGSGSASPSRPGSSHGPAVVAATPEMPTGIKSFEATPSSVSSSRPASAHSWKDDESPLGGAGPKTRKIDVSPTKQAWVDGMLEQARNAATVDRTMNFGDLGKVGGTKRVYLRSKTAQ